MGNSIVSGLSTKQTEKQAERKGNEAFEKAKAAGMTDTQASKVATDEMLSMLPPEKRRQLLVDNDGERLSINFAGENGKVDRNQGGLSMSMAGDDFRSRHASLVDFISDEGLWGNNQMLGLASGLLDKRAAYYSYDSITKRGQQAFESAVANSQARYNHINRDRIAQQQRQQLTTKALTPKMDGTYFFGGAGMDGHEYILDMASSFKKAGISDVHIPDRTLFSNGQLPDAIYGVNRYRYSNVGFDTTMPNLGDGKGQFNLVGYSYGSLVASQVAFKYAREGVVVDNLVLVGSPISQAFLDDLKGVPNIKNVIIKDLNHVQDPLYAGMSLPALTASVPTLFKQQNSSEPGTGHFYYASNNNVGSERRLILANELFKQGLK